MRILGVAAVALAAMFAAECRAQPAKKDTTALRRQCAHALKVRMRIKETGRVEDLQGVRGAIAQVDRCVANGGRLD